ncbi:MAG: polyamine aminopropyltransferase [Cyanobacteriota bacterium]
MTTSQQTEPAIKKPFIILIVVCIVAVCGIVYELLISTAASYLLGDSVKQFSIIIGIYMSSMGVGAYLTKFINNKLLEKFIIVEIVLSIIGGISVLGIFWFFSLGGIFFVFVLYFLTVVIGILVGLEIPLVMRIMEKTFNLKDNVANVLAYDYIGGLIGSIAFPLILLPGLGIMRTSILIGGLNLLSALWLIVKIKEFPFRSRYLIITVIFTICLIVGFIYAKPISNYLEQNFYRDQIVYSMQTPYQKVVVTKYKNDIRLFIDGNLQFSSLDEYRYHEGIVHIPASFSPNLEKVLVLGGGDGLAARELLKYKSIKNITLVDLDAKLLDLFKNDKLLTSLNNKSLKNKKVKVYSKDGLSFLKEDETFYDLIIVDLPDPRTPELSNLYNKQFYDLVQKRLSKTGIMVTQATSPFFARDAFWCIAETVKESFPYSSQFHINVMSFGDWGFIIGSKIPVENRIDDIKIDVETRYLDSKLAKNAFLFGKDVIKPEDIEINTLFSPVLVEYYKKGWASWE